MGPGWAADPRLSFQKSIRPQVVTTFELPGCYDMWTVIAPVRKEQVCVPRLATSSWRCWPAPGLLGVPTGRRARDPALCLSGLLLRRHGLGQESLPSSAFTGGDPQGGGHGARAWCS